MTIDNRINLVIDSFRIFSGAEGPLTIISDLVLTRYIGRVYRIKFYRDNKKRKV